MNKIVSSTQKWIEKDRRVWITAKPNLPNLLNDAFLQATVAAIHQKQIQINLRQMTEQGVAYDTKTFKVAYEDCQKLTYGPNDVSDMVELEQLNQPELLFNLKRRYNTDLIFTYCGPTLVIINPYAVVDKLFNDQVLLDYQTYVFQDNLQYKTLPPHIFGLAAFCLWQLFENLRNQSIVISGQSGAGKTQNTKYCLKFLASLGKNMRGMINQNRSSKYISMKTVRSVVRTNAKLQGIQDKILGCNEILEAFGNAKTIRNDNSSRFGKLILLIYGQTQIDIKSAFIVSYLLQKSRIVSISQGERNYHMFYYLLKGTTAEERKEYMLTDSISNYHYLNQSSVYDIKGVSDEKKFNEVVHEFSMYFTKEESSCIFKIISIVLNIGNLIFRKELSKNNQEMAIPVNKDYLVTVAKLLGVSYEDFQHSFQYKTRKMGVSVINSPLRFDEAVALQNSFAKNIYERTFNFLVIKLNQKIQLQKVNLQNNNKAFRKSIGLLDIFGFQVLGINSLQQFFINFANQKLQQLYVSYIFKQQQNQFLKEGLKQFSHDIGFQDNKPVIDLFQLYPLGLFHLINESSQLNKPDQDLPQSIAKNHPKNQFLQIPKSKRGIFLITHSCSPVNYNTAGFTSRNKDEFPQQLLDIIQKSSDQNMIRIIFGNSQVPQSKNRTAAKKFLGSKFLNQMNKLTQELYSSDCHFVRCIKPNNFKAPKMFNSQAILQSLRYLGVLDSILIRKLGYIYRRPFKQFIKKFIEIEQYIYGFSKFVQGKTEEDFKEYSKNFILKHASNELGNREILLGHKKILIKESALNHLEAMAKEKRKMRIQCANKIKRMYISSVFRGQVSKFLNSIKILKTNLKFVIQKIREKIMNKKCTKVQRHIKKYLLQKRLQKIKEQATKSVNKLSSTYKMLKQRKIFLLTKKKIVKIQANIRFFLTMANYFKQKNCRETAYDIFQSGWLRIQSEKAVIIQKIWKGYLIKRKFNQIMEQIRKKLRLAKYRQQLLKVVAHHKYQNYLKMINKYKQPIIKMQAIVRGKFARRTFIIMKRYAILIQKAYRRHLKKKYYLIRLWRDYRKNIYLEERMKVKEVGRIAVNIVDVDGVKYYPETVGAMMQLYPQELRYKYAKDETAKQNLLINQTIPFNDKNTFQIYIGDYDIIGTQYYEGKWLVKYSEAKQQMKKKNEYPIHVTIGEQFTSILTNKDRMYSIYAGEKSRQNRFQIGAGVYCQQMGDRTCYLLKNQGKVYVWGSNYDNYVDGSQEEQIQYKEVTTVSKLNISQIICKGSKRYMIDKDGKTYHYVQTKTDTYKWSLTALDFGSKLSVKTVAASYHFSLFLTTQGQVYSQGFNRKGQLGLGFTSRKQITQPTLISYFVKQNKQIIETISVGMSHSVAKSKLGYVYTWGDNCYQQTSSKQIQYLHSPQQMENQQGKLKVLQAVAGSRATFLLSQNLKTIGFGTSSSFPSQKGIFNLPLELLKQTSSCKTLIQIKLSVSWIRELSILFINAIDLSRCKSNTKPDSIIKYTKMMAKEWNDHRVYPLYHQWADNILQLSDLRKFKFGTNQLANKNGGVKKLENRQGKQSELQELRALMQLRKTSAVFKKAAAQKMEQLLQRLNSRPQQYWSQTDRELHHFIQQNGRLLK